MQKNKITGWQFCFLTIQTQLGMSALSMPSTISKEAGQDAWISLLLGAMIVQVVIIFYIWLLSRCRESSYFEYLSIVYGKYIGKVLLLTTVLFLIFSLIIVILMYQELITDWINLYTPSWIIIMLLLLPAVYLATAPIALIGRFSLLISMLLPITIVLIIVVYASPQFYYLLPIGSEGAEAIIKGIKPSIIAFSGFEIILFAGHFLHGQKVSELKKGMLGTFFVTLFYLYLIISVQVFFFIDEIKIIPYPVLYILKAVSFTIVDRIDILFLTFWIVFSAAVCINYLFMAGIGIQQLFNLKSHKYAVISVSVIVFAFSIFVQSKAMIDQLDQWSFEAGIVMVIVIPIITLIVSLITKRMGTN